jgi:hypothetical protein
MWVNNICPKMSPLQKIAVNAPEITRKFTNVFTHFPENIHFDSVSPPSSKSTSMASDTGEASCTFILVASSAGLVVVTVARLFRTFPAKVAGNFEKILPLPKCHENNFFRHLL